MRLPDDLDIEKTMHSQGGLLQFEDGSQKTLAAFMVWLGLVALVPVFDEEDFRSPGVLTLIQSLLSIGGIRKQAHADALDGLVSRVVKQNSDSKVQPISSFQWAVMLQTLFSKSENITLDGAIARYNSHPEVQAQGGKMTAPCSILWRGTIGMGLVPLFVPSSHFWTSD